MAARAARGLWTINRARKCPKANTLLYFTGHVAYNIRIHKCRS